MEQVDGGIKQGDGGDETARADGVEEEVQRNCHPHAKKNNHTGKKICQRIGFIVCCRDECIYWSRSVGVTTGAVILEEGNDKKRA